MKARIHIDNPDAAEVTITLSMTLGQWKQVLSELGDGYPAWKVKAVIQDAIQKVDARLSIDTDRDN